MLMIELVGESLHLHYLSEGEVYDNRKNITMVRGQERREEESCRRCGFVAH